MEVTRHLAETIGPRGSCTAKEREAARYVADVLSQAGMNPHTEEFTSIRSCYVPYAIFSGLIVAAELLAWFGGWAGLWAALGLTVFATGSAFVHMTFRSNPLSWLTPRGKSQNVWVRIEPEGEARHQVVVVGHLDSHRTPLLFARRWVKLLEPLVPLAMVSSFALMVLFSLGLAWPGPVWMLVSLPFAGLIGLVFILMVQADLTPFAPGANDNATGAGVVTRLAIRLHGRPLARTRVWALLSGCEEVGCTGADAFLRRHMGELGQAFWIPVDSVGGMGAGVACLEKETFLLTSGSDPGLLELAAEIAGRRPDLEVYRTRMKGAFTEGAIGTKHGLRALPLCSLRRDGVLPEWHRMSDVMENVDEKVVDKTLDFLGELLSGIDDL
jgi:hypothetical protein